MEPETKRVCLDFDSSIDDKENYAALNNLKRPQDQKKKVKDESKCSGKAYCECKPFFEAEPLHLYHTLYDNGVTNPYFSSEHYNDPVNITEDDPPFLIDLKLKTVCAKRIQHDYNQLLRICKKLDFEAILCKNKSDTIKRRISVIIRNQRIVIKCIATKLTKGYCWELPNNRNRIGLEELAGIIHHTSDPLPLFNSLQEQMEALYESTKLTLEATEMAAKGKILQPSGLFYPHPFSLALWIQLNIGEPIRNTHQDIDSLKYGHAYF